MVASRFESWPRTRQLSSSFGRDSWRWSRGTRPTPGVRPRRSGPRWATRRRMRVRAAWRPARARRAPGPGPVLARALAPRAGRPGGRRVRGCGRWPAQDRGAGCGGTCRRTSRCRSCRARWSRSTCPSWTWTARTRTGSRRTTRARPSPSLGSRGSVSRWRSRSTRCSGGRWCGTARTCSLTRWGTWPGCGPSTR